VTKKKHSKLPGSTSAFFTNENIISKERAEGKEELQIILVLKPSSRTKISWNKEVSIKKHKENFKKRYSILDDELAKIIDFSMTYKLQIDSVVKDLGLVYISGTINNFEKAFQVELHSHTYKNEILRHKQSVLGHEGGQSIPKALKNIVIGTIGLSRVPLLHHTASTNDKQSKKMFSAASAYPSSWFSDYYNFPEKQSGNGQTIGIVSCGGGLKQKDMNHYLKKIGLKIKNKLKFVSIDGATNNPGGEFLYDYEIATDCQVCQVAAPNAKIKVYSTTNSLKGFADAILAITKERRGRPSIISYSWGANESNYSLSEVKGVNRILKYATLVKEITIFCSAGDAGSTNNYKSTPETSLAVQFPSCSPWVTSCGGTTIHTDEDGRITGETVWNSQFNLYDILVSNATGGGYSKYLNKPNYQKNAMQDNHIESPSTKRGIPDISAHADLSPAGIGYWIYFQGQNWMSGGTSAVAPLLAALIARLNEALGYKIGFLNPHLYKMSGSEAIRNITEGNNAMPNGPDQWMATEGWNPCTGLGVPNGKEMLKYFENIS